MEDDWLLAAKMAWYRSSILECKEQKKFNFATMLVSVASLGAQTVKGWQLDAATALREYSM
jgi:hypothetical protein